MKNTKRMPGAQEYLADMRAAIHAAREFSRDITFEQFRENKEKQFAIIHALRDSTAESIPNIGYNRDNGM